MFSDESRSSQLLSATRSQRRGDRVVTFLNLPLPLLPFSKPQALSFSLLGEEICVGVLFWALFLFHFTC